MILETQYGRTIQFKEVTGLISNAHGTYYETASFSGNTRVKHEDECTLIRLYTDGGDDLLTVRDRRG